MTFSLKIYINTQYLLVLSASKNMLVKEGSDAIVTKCHMGEGGSKIGQKSVTYYLNGPKPQITQIFTVKH